jgi:3-oxoacyl-[acyl-carrier protein] reductase
VAVVTGAAQGVGAAIAVRLAAEGAAVMVNDLDADGAEQTAGRIRENGGKAATCAVSVTDEAVVRELM